MLIKNAMLLLACGFFLFASVKPDFQLTGQQYQPTDPQQIRVLMSFPPDPRDYEVIGIMNDCSSFSEYAEFVSVYKKEAAKYGANCIIIHKSPEESAQEYGICVEASAVRLVEKQQRQNSPATSNRGDCVSELKQIIQLQRVIDSLRIELNKCKY